MDGKIGMIKGRFSLCNEMGGVGEEVEMETDPQTGLGWFWIETTVAMVLRSLLETEEVW